MPRALKSKWGPGAFEAGPRLLSEKSAAAKATAAVLLAAAEAAERTLLFLQEVPAAPRHN